MSVADILCRLGLHKDGRLLTCHRCGRERRPDVIIATAEGTFIGEHKHYASRVEAEAAMEALCPKPSWLTPASGYDQTASDAAAGVGHYDWQVREVVAAVLRDHHDKHGDSLTEAIDRDVHEDIARAVDAVQRRSAA